MALTCLVQLRWGVVGVMSGKRLRPEMQRGKDDLKVTGELGELFVPFASMARTHRSSTFRCVTLRVTGMTQPRTERSRVVF